LKQPVVLRVYLDGQLESVKQFTESQVVIGKNNGLQLQLAGNYIAPLHAVIEERDNGYYISDLGSEHGIFVNGQKVLDQQINTGDEISLGSYKLQFFIGVPNSAVPSAPQIDNDLIENSNKVPPKVIEAELPKAPDVIANKALPEEGEDYVVEKAAKLPEEPAKLPDTPIKIPEALVNIEPPKEKVIEPPKEKVIEPPKEKVIKPPKEEVVEPVKVEAPTPVKTPEVSKVAVATAVGSLSKKKGGKGYFAPASQVNDWMPILEPDKGTVVEVSVAWKERIISSHHFNNKKSVTIGSDESCDINVPVLGANSLKYDLLKVDSVAKVNVTPQMSGVYVDENKKTTPLDELFRDGKIVSGPKGHILDVSFGDMVVLELEGGLLKLYIRYVPQAPKTFGAPIFDLSTAESTAVILATVVASIFSLYMMVYTPVDLTDENLIEEELVRKAKVTFKVPKRKPVKKIVDKTPEKPKVRKKFKVTEKKAQPKKKVAKTPNPTQTKAGKSKGLKKNKNLPKTNKKASSVKKGAAIKTTKKPGANMKSVTVDPTKTGLLSAFGSKGMQKELSKAYDGKGELAGMADNATGTAGQDRDRDGDNLGGSLKAGSGNGKSTVGGGGVNTDGAGTGTDGLGSGGGLGAKGNAQIDVGGAEEDFVGSIDKEAIRRVIRKNKRAIKACYELALNRNKNLYGKLVLQWSIIEKGKAIKPKVVSNSLNDKEVANCIKRKLVTWRFPEPPANTEGVVTFPFVFSSQ